MSSIIQLNDPNTAESFIELPPPYPGVTKEEHQQGVPSQSYSPSSDALLPNANFIPGQQQTRAVSGASDGRRPVRHISECRFFLSSPCNTLFISAGWCIALCGLSQFPWLSWIWYLLALPCAIPSQILIVDQFTRLH